MVYGTDLTENDWIVPYEDLDPEAPFCTPHSTNKDFACEQIKCIIRRKNKTDDVYDVQFATTAGTNDTMEIAAGRAFVHINMSTQSEDANRYMIESWAAA